MKELEIKNHNPIELSVKQKKQVEYELIGKIIPHENHTIWQINIETLEITKAKFSNATFVVIGQQNKKELIIKDGHYYVSALNKKNALKKFHKGENGSKEISKYILSL